MQRRLAQGDADAAHLNGREQGHQAALQPLRHAGGISVQKQLREPREHFVGNRLAGGEDDVVLVAAPDHRLRNLWRAGFEKQDADRQRQLEIVVAEHLPQRVPELFELDQGVAPVLRAGAAEDLDGTRGEPDPVLARYGRQGHETAQQKQPPHAFIVTGLVAQASACESRASGLFSSPPMAKNSKRYDPRSIFAGTPDLPAGRRRSPPGFRRDGRRSAGRTARRPAQRIAAHAMGTAGALAARAVGHPGIRTQTETCLTAVARGLLAGHPGAPRRYRVGQKRQSVPRRPGHHPAHGEEFESQSPFAHSARRRPDGAARGAPGGGPQRLSSGPNGVGAAAARRVEVMPLDWSPLWLSLRYAGGATLLAMLVALPL